MKIFRICGKYIKAHKVYFFIYGALALLSRLVALLSPYVMGNFVDGLVTDWNMEFVYRYCGIVCIIAIFSLVLDYMSRMVYIKLQMSMGAEYNLDIIRHIQRLPHLQVSGWDMTRINQQINQDANALVIFCLSIASSFVGSAMVLLILMVVCFRMNWVISLLFMIYCGGYVVVYHLAKNKKFKITHKLFDTQNQFFAGLFEQLQYIDFIRMQSVDTFFRKKIEKPYQELFASTIESQKYGFYLGGIDSLLALLSQVTLFVVGAQQIMSCNFTIGDFVTFSAFFSMIMSSIRYFYGLGSVYQETMVSYNRIKQITDLPEESVGDVTLKNLTSIQIENLKFAYAKEPILHIKNVTIKRGEICGVYGKNGSGKTTFIKLLLGSINEKIEPSSVWLGDVDLLQINQQALRRDIISYAEQNATLFPGTVLDNILLDREPTEELMTHIHELAILLNVEDLVFPTQGIVQKMISSLSGGECQKITIIRTLIKKAELILFDEPTAAMDVCSRDNLLAYLEKIKSEKIIVLITHDDKVLDICDQVVRM